MFTVHDESIFRESPNARRAFQRKEQLDKIARGLFGLLCLAAIWNIYQLVELRLIESQDLSDVRSIMELWSTRTIWILSLFTIGVILYRDFTVGEWSWDLTWPFTGLLAFLLLPTIMAEIEPQVQTHSLRIMAYTCPSTALVDGQMHDPHGCEPRQIDNGAIVMLNADPTRMEAEEITHEVSAQNTNIWTVSGRGQYMVYFLVRQPDMAACEQSVIFEQYLGVDGMRGSRCVTWNGETWFLMPHETAGNRPGSLYLIFIED